MERSVEPEILDDLPAEDERAIRSRRDLRLINGLMGNERWIESVVRKELTMRKQENAGVVELGAGRGELLSRLSLLGVRVTGLDLLEKPDLLEGVDWMCGDLLETLPKAQGRVVVGSLVLHHFEKETLARLGEMLSRREVLVFAEPLRSRLALLEGRVLCPLVGEVTRADMMTSIRAGFVRGELPSLLNLVGSWQWEERVTLRGGLRAVARKTSVAIL